MMKFKKLTVMMITSVMLCSNALICAAEDLVWPEGAKKDILNLAKEQDRFVLLFVGNYDCPLCKVSWAYFNQNTLRQIIDDNYNTWFFSYYLRGTSIRSDYKDIKLYIADYDEHKSAGIPTNFPILALINPDDPDEDFTFFWGRGARTFEELYAFITSPPDLFAGNTLTWYNDEDEDKVFKMAKEQGKYILQFVGRATSPNSKKVLKHLNEEPLKSMLEDNYILWFSSKYPQTTSSTFDDDDTPRLYPLISIWDESDRLEMTNGYKDAEELETVIKKYSVSNETIAPDNQVTVIGNVIQIANGNHKEQITVFSLSGQQVASIRKNDYSIKIDAFAYPKGVLIVNSSAGWSKKIIVQ